MDMMHGHSYTRQSLRQAIVDRFGADATFHTCSAEGLDADGIIDFLEQRGKFMPADADSNGFTVDISKRCSHDD